MIKTSQEHKAQTIDLPCIVKSKQSNIVYLVSQEEEFTCLSSPTKDNIGLVHNNINLDEMEEYTGRITLENINQ